jgi:2'-5' RNA ligase
MTDPFMFDLRRRYDQMFQDAINCFSRNDYAVDHHIDDLHDNRFGLILNVCPTDDVKSKVSEFQRRFKAIDPGQYHYSPDDLHFTVIAIVSCKPGFTISGLDIEAYKHIIRDALFTMEPFDINCSGLTAFSGGVMMQGFPSADKLNLLRDNLRRIFNTSALFHSIDSRYRIQTAHSTIIRFKKPLIDIRLMQQFLQENRGIFFGNFIVKEIELVYSDWYHRKKNTTVLEKFKL